LDSSKVLSFDLGRILLGEDEPEELSTSITLSSIYSLMVLIITCADLSVGETKPESLCLLDDMMLPLTDAKPLTALIRCIDPVASGGCRVPELLLGGTS
jgi:hypothetical protein